MRAAVRLLAPTGATRKTGPHKQDVLQLVLKSEQKCFLSPNALALSEGSDAGAHSCVVRLLGSVDRDVESYLEGGRSSLEKHMQRNTVKVLVQRLRFAAAELNVAGEIAQQEGDAALLEQLCALADRVKGCIDGVFLFSGKPQPDEANQSGSKSAAIGPQKNLR